MNNIDKFEKMNYLSCKYLLKNNFIVNGVKSFYKKDFKVEEIEKYFKKYGGDKWEEKYKMSKSFKDYTNYISSYKFEEELNVCMKKCIVELVELIEEEYDDEEIKNLTLNDLYYTWEQVYKNIKTT